MLRTGSSLAMKPNFEVPKADPWLKGFVWDDCFSTTDNRLEAASAKFSAAVSESEKLLANADALLSHYR